MFQDVHQGDCNCSWAKNSFRLFFLSKSFLGRKPELFPLNLGWQLLALLCHSGHLLFFLVAQQVFKLLTHPGKLPLLKILGGRPCYEAAKKLNAVYSLFPKFLYSEGSNMWPGLLQSDTSITDWESGIHDARSLDSEEDSGSGSSCRVTRRWASRGVNARGSIQFSKVAA